MKRRQTQLLQKSFLFFFIFLYNRACKNVIFLKSLNNCISTLLRVLLTFSSTWCASNISYAFARVSCCNLMVKTVSFCPCFFKHHYPHLFSIRSWECWLTVTTWDIVVNHGKLSFTIRAKTTPYSPAAFLSSLTNSLLILSGSSLRADKLDKK